jgi:hypothetical protein
MKKRFFSAGTVKLSTPFLLKSKCRNCGTSGLYYYIIRNGAFFISPEGSKLISEIYQRFTKRMCSDYYLMDSPSKYRSNSFFNYSKSHKGYNPKIYKNLNVKSNNNNVEIFSCECGKTQWAFGNTNDDNRPEICNRKSNRAFLSVKNYLKFKM